MIQYVAFLRGINLAGNTTIRMADLREVFEQSGFAGVRTYIQTGNVIFASKETNIAKLTRKIEKALLAAFHFEVKVLVLTVAELEEVVKLDPFKNIEDNDAIRTYVTFHSPLPDNWEPPPSFAKAGVEILGRRKQALLLLCRRKENGQIEFPNALCEKSVKISATTRNWNTVRKTLELARKA